MRLIDADKLPYEDVESVDGNTYMCVNAYDIEHAPTIEQSEDCISRTELLAKIDEERKHLLDLKMDGAEHIVVHHARRIIEDMPSATPQPKRGKWIFDGVKTYCSQCGKNTMGVQGNFCSNCGADMRESEG